MIELKKFYKNDIEDLDDNLIKEGKKFCDDDMENFEDDGTDGDVEKVCEDMKEVEE